MGSALADVDGNVVAVVATLPTIRREVTTHFRHPG